MSSDGDADTCHFGHHFELDSRGKEGLSDDAEEAIGDIKGGKIRSLEEFKKKYSENPDSGVNGLIDIMGSPVRHMKVSGGGQGAGYGAILSAADKFDNDLGYSSHRVTESIFVSPQSQLHDEFMQRKQQAEQRVNQTLSSFSDILEQKHLLEHDIRKLRGRSEAFDSKDEDILKGDFVELVDGANAGAQQGGEAAMKTLVERNIYPTIMSDFMEMDSVDDLKSEEDGGTGKLADLPNNEKAILRKKYAMYEKWKDLYGSEVNRRLNELKSQIQNIERSIDNTKNWLEPYVRDVVMINELGDSQTKLSNYHQWKGYSSMLRELEFLCHKGLEKREGKLYPVEDNSKATHYRIMHIMGVHVVQASGEQPNQPGGSSTGVVFWRPAVVCEHVFKNIFKPRIDRADALVDEMMDDYVGEFEPGKGKEYRDKRKQKEFSVRELREKVEEELDDSVPIEFSSKIRRIEDGLDTPKSVEEDYSEEYFNALNNVLEIEDGSGEAEDEMYSGLEQELKKFTGQTDKYYVEKGGMSAMMEEFRFDFYFDYKIGLGLNTMK